MQKIPALREYFELIKDTPLQTNIELKTGIFEYTGIEEKVLKLIDEYDLRSRIIISSFNHYSVLRMKALAPDMRYGFLEGSWIVDFADYAKVNGVDALHPIFCAVNAEFMKKARKNGLMVNVWTVNEDEDIRLMADLGTDIIITNFPDNCSQILEKMGKRG